ncbi:CRK3 [Symbiodinium natans]|uniref:Cyclin-dependent kinase 2 homolog n=1 Tax=Symbiodinium natans TaxID=878477 RepID=A0A812UWI9_9DINO|nr:CRK3 [Symbiodinium natans]
MTQEDQDLKPQPVVPREPVDEGMRSWRFSGGGFELSLEQKLGGGTYGAVYLATDRSGRPWALKVARCDQFLEELAKENRILMKLRHPSVVMAWGLLAGPSATMGMPMEKADIDLRRALRGACSTFTMMKRWQVAHQLLQGLEYIHEMGCIHLDLKPGNLLLFQLCEQSVLMKICDFGLCREMKQGSVTLSGQEAFTANYRPLECWLHLKKAFQCGPEADLWAAGCIFYEMLSDHSEMLFPYPDQLIKSSDVRKAIFEARDTMLTFVKLTMAKEFVQGQVCARSRRLTVQRSATLCLDALSRGRARPLPEVPQAVGHQTG